MTSFDVAHCGGKTPIRLLISILPCDRHDVRKNWSLLTCDLVMFRRESYRYVCCLKTFFKHMNLLCFIISRKSELIREYGSNL